MWSEPANSPNNIIYLWPHKAYDRERRHSLGRVLSPLTHNKRLTFLKLYHTLKKKCNYREEKVALEARLRLYPSHYIWQSFGTGNRNCISFISESQMAGLPMKTHGQSNPIITEESNINHLNGLAPVLSSTNATKLTCIHSHNTFLKVKSKTRHLYLHAEHWQRKHWKEKCQYNKRKKAYHYYKHCKINS